MFPSPSPDIVYRQARCLTLSEFPFLHDNIFPSLLEFLKSSQKQILMNVTVDLQLLCWYQSVILSATNESPSIPEAAVSSNPNVHPLLLAKRRLSAPSS